MLSPRPSEVAAFGDALDLLVREPAVVGALVAAPDGLPVTLRMEQAGDAWAAVAAVLGNAAGRLSEAAGHGPALAGVFRGDDYQYVVRPVEVGFLLALAAPEADAAELARRVAEAAQAIDAAARALTA